MKIENHRHHPGLSENYAQQHGGRNLQGSSFIQKYFTTGIMLGGVKE